MFRIILAAMTLFAASPALSQTLIIAHRGASGERPEHTRAAYELAIEQGADVIEPDLVKTRDGVLVVRHENEISGTTDVAAHPEFADRRTRKIIDGAAVTGWFTEDFTLAELRTLRARERLPELRPANTAWDGREPILTFEEVIAIARAGSERTGRTIGVAPELKHPTYFRAQGLDMIGPFVAILRTEGLMSADAPILIQCFEVEPLKALRAAGVEAPLLLLIAAGQGPEDAGTALAMAHASPRGLAEIAAWADWIGVETPLIEPEAGRPSSLIADAHAAGLKVAAWTFRAENAFLPKMDRIGDEPSAHGRLRERLSRFASYGLDAAFMDQPGLR